MTIFHDADVPANKSAERFSGQLAALAHPARLEIVRHLGRSPACCCGDVVRRIGLAQSTTSQHLKVLVEAGLVTFSPDRQRSRYQLDRQALSALSASLAALVASCGDPD
ncbi:MAG: metalloregulator ArsR/SmtB family transcription factor [Rhizobiaceae bacterium]